MVIQSLGNEPESKESWNSIDSGELITSASAFNICAGMQSGPQALSPCKFTSSS